MLSFVWYNGGMEKMSGLPKINSMGNILSAAGILRRGQNNPGHYDGGKIIQEVFITKGQK